IRRRVWRNCNLQLAIANHVEQNSAAKCFGRFILCELVSKMAAPVNPVSLAEIFNRLFAIKESEFDFLGEPGFKRQHSRHFQKHAGARTAIIGANESKGVEDFCVVMRTE